MKRFSVAALVAVLALGCGLPQPASFPIAGPAESPITLSAAASTGRGHASPEKAQKPFLNTVKLVRGDPRIRNIALTFDDGPHAGFTDVLVRMLAQFKVKATFFMIGRNVDENPDLVREARAAGIQLAQHTYSHTRLAMVDDYTVRSELLLGAEAVERATGIRPRYFRPPGGEYDERVTRIAQELGMTMVLWTADAGDFTTSAGNPSSESIYRHVMKTASPGGIVIMHDPMPSTLVALPSIIMGLRAKGYQFVTVAELAAEQGAIRTGGPRIKPLRSLAVQSPAVKRGYYRRNSPEEHHEDSEQRIANASPAKRGASQGTGRPGESRIEGRQGTIGLQ